MLFIPQDGFAGLVQAGSTLALKTQIKLRLKNMREWEMSEHKMSGAYITSWQRRDVTLEEQPTPALALAADWTGTVNDNVGSTLKQELK